ncbi:MAG: methionyl-tRNA formyltransferase [Pseudomonadota bacterium]|nr:methionyl-tRNA formyltransferase [Pseudomonadota bacterium]
MRILFAGTPRFAVVCLNALLHTHHQVVAVFTQPDRRAGRGKKWLSSEVKQRAESLGLPIEQPARLSDPQVQSHMAAYRPDVLVVVAYGMILPAHLLTLAPLGAVNVHASLLPRWRGAAPIQRAIMAGDSETGITIIRMDTGLDTGPALLREAVSIGERENAGQLHDRLAEVGASLLVDALGQLEQGLARETPQASTGATYAAKLTAEDFLIDWRHPATQIDRQIRALAPHPGARTSYAGSLVKVLRARPTVSESAGHGPGAITAVRSDGISVATGSGALCVEDLQAEGGRVMAAADFARGRTITVGARLGSDEGELS